MYREFMKKNPNRPATRRSWTRLAPHTLRGLNTRSGKSGLFAVSCRTANPASKRIDTVPSPMVWAEAQPTCEVSTIV